MRGHHVQQTGRQPGMVANPARTTYSDEVEVMNIHLLYRIQS